MVGFFFGEAERKMLDVGGIHNPLMSMMILPSSSANQSSLSIEGTATTAARCWEDDSCLLSL